MIECWDGLPIATTPPTPPSYWAAWCKHKADCSLQNAWACSRQLERSRHASPPRLPLPLAPSSTAIAAPAVLVPPPSWIWVSVGPLAEAGTERLVTCSVERVERVSREHVKLCCSFCLNAGGVKLTSCSLSMQCVDFFLDLYLRDAVAPPSTQSYPCTRQLAGAV